MEYRMERDTLGDVKVPRCKGAQRRLLRCPDSAGGGKLPGKFPAFTAGLYKSAGNSQKIGGGRQYCRGEA